MSTLFGLIGIALDAFLASFWRDRLRLSKGCAHDNSYGQIDHATLRYETIGFSSF